jgi:shikimate dehydrogenase
MLKNSLQTKMCISIAQAPSLFGMTVHNAGYRALKLDYVYKAFKVDNVREAMTAVRALGIRGCSVSMPFKEQVLPYLDVIDPVAKTVGAVNTVVNVNGRLFGYNTDVRGAREAIKAMKVDTQVPALILGAGGAARAILYALKDLGFKHITISNRNRARVNPLFKIASFEVVDWRKRESIRAGFIINATSIGMAPHVRQMPVSAKVIDQSIAVFDVIINPMESLFIREARSLKKKISPGYKMSLYQAIAQFKLYTGHQPPVKVMEAAVKRLLKRRG